MPLMFLKGFLRVFTTCFKRNSLFYSYHKFLTYVSVLAASLQSYRINPLVLWTKECLSVNYKGNGGYIWLLSSDVVSHKGGTSCLFIELLFIPLCNHNFHGFLNKHSCFDLSSYICGGFHGQTWWENLHLQ